jgi:hypothetical protein
MNPFVGLRPFERSEQGVFFGRDRESLVLANLVATLPVLVLFAPSGTGKSSLINAGLLPHLERSSDQVPVVVGSAQDVVEAVRSRVLSGGEPDRDIGLSELLERSYLLRDQRTVVIMDQFEERLNSEQELEGLYDEIAKLVHSGSDAACFVLSIREDYLGSLEPLMRRIPGLLSSSYRVPALSRQALREAVYGPLDNAQRAVRIEPDLVDRTLDDLLSRADLLREPGEQRFEPGYFQIVWSTLWDQATQTGKGQIGISDYRELGGAGQILKSFISNILNALDPAQAQMFWAVCRYLVLPTGAKTSLTVDDLAQLVRPADYLTHESQISWLARLPADRQRMLIRSLMERLTSSTAPIFQRAVRGEREEFELLHDLLGRIILDWRHEYERAYPDLLADARRTVGASAKQEQRWYLKTAARASQNKYDYEDSSFPDVFGDPQEGLATPSVGSRLQRYRVTGNHDLLDACILRALQVLDDLDAAVIHLAKPSKYSSDSAALAAIEEQVGRFVYWLTLLSASTDYGAPRSQGLQDHAARWQMESARASDTIRALAFDSPSTDARRRLQLLVPFLVSGIPIMSFRYDWTAKKVREVAFAIGAAAPPMLIGAVLASRLVPHARYLPLIMTIAGVVLGGFYGLVVTEQTTTTAARQLRGDQRWSFRELFFPKPPSDPRRWRWARLAAWWPLPGIWIALFGSAGGGLFALFGWGVTAGFTLGAVVGVPLVLGLIAWASDF